jgi:hypothetical protein
MVPYPYARSATGGMDRGNRENAEFSIILNYRKGYAYRGRSAGFRIGKLPVTALSLLLNYSAMELLIESAWKTDGTAI